MMPSPQQQQPPASINQLQDMMINVVFNLCSIPALPLEMVLRIKYGSQYFQPTTQFLAAVMMMLLPLFSELATGIARMLPLIRIPPTMGMFGIGTLSKLFFLGSLVHGYRVWRLMLHPEREQVSVYEGPALPLFHIVPLPFWVTRIFVEPIAVFLVASLLQNLFILQPSATHYLMFAAICLAMKQYIAWFLQWRYLRNLLDMRNMGPIIASLLQNTATEDDLAKMHMASVPKNMPEEIRQTFASHFARAFSPEGEAPKSSPEAKS